MSKQLCGSDTDSTPTVSPARQRKQRQEFTANWARMSQQDTLVFQEQNESTGDILQDESLYQAFGGRDITEDSYLDDDACSLVESSAWHDNDLILAAELGKALLERNRELEARNNHLQELTCDQKQEINLLIRQLETLKELNESKLKMYEDIDKHYTELEIQNSSLKNKTEQDQLRIKSLTQSVQTLENRVEELKQKSREMERCNEFPIEIAIKDKITPTKLRKTNSFPFIHPLVDPINYEHHKLERDYFDTLDRVSDYKFQISKLQLNNEELKCNLEYQISENDILQDELTRLTRSMRSPTKPLVCPRCAEAQSKERAVHCTPMEQCDYESFYPGLSDEYEPLVVETNCENNAVDDLLSPIETDTSDLHGLVNCGLLQSGGKVYSSEDNLEKIGASKLADAGQTLREVSLLNELNDEYDKLVKEYEQLVSNKKVRTSESSNDSNYPVNSQFESKLSNIFHEDTRAERKRITAQNYKPKYKELFREALSTLNSIKTKD